MRIKNKPILNQCVDIEMCCTSILDGYIYNFIDFNYNKYVSKNNQPTVLCSQDQIQINRLVKSYHSVGKKNQILIIDTDDSPSC